MKTCFVAMGFGQKTAFYGGKKKQRTLDLDRTYRNIIQPAVSAVGLRCIRADEILHSTLIDKPMYEHLLEADVVIADLSTSNANAIYELGVRHALRPRTTLVIAERDFAFPFDLAHLSILKYEHLGVDIGASEARRVTDELKQKLLAVTAKEDVDSPVFVFLPHLVTPAASQVAEAATAPALGPSVADLQRAFVEAKAAAEPPAIEEPWMPAEIAAINAVTTAQTASDWRVVVERLEEWRQLQPDEPYIIQQLALATYKSENPDPVSALLAAREILEALSPRLSSDAETVGLWGAIHKLLWEACESRPDLDEAIRAYLRGFLLRNDHYNGINYAFLLNVRAVRSTGEDVVTDRTLANRVRQEVLEICTNLIRDEAGQNEDFAVVKAEERYWLRASRAEALFGLGRFEEARRALEAANAIEPAPSRWMVASTDRQIGKLQALLG